MDSNRRNESQVPQAQSPANTTISGTATVKAPENCRKCQRQLKLIRDAKTRENGLCWACAVLERQMAEPGVKCPKCGKIWAGLVDPGMCLDCKNGENALAARQKLYQERLVKAFGSEVAAAQYTLANFQPIEGTEKALQVSQSFMATPRKMGVYLWGKTRRGKTHLAYAVGRELILQGLDVEVTNTREMTARFRTKDPEKSEAAMLRLERVDAIILDDFGVARFTEPSIEVICEVFNRRSLHGRNGWFITSNLFLDDLAKKNEDDRLTARIAETCHVVELNTTKDFWGKP